MELLQMSWTETLLEASSNTTQANTFTFQANILRNGKD